jgi:carboxyl-terminal processing protease
MVVKTTYKGLFSALILMLSSYSYAQDLTASTDKDDANNVLVEDIQRFSNAIHLIKKYYVKQIDDKTLFENAIRGMLSHLDPHSNYLDEEEYNDLNTMTTGKFGGLGLEVTMEDGAVKVITPLVDTPAFKSGIKSGDYIIKIGNKAVQGLDLKTAVKLMRGEPRSYIKLTVLRKEAKKPLFFNVMREKIEIKSVKNELFDNKYGYIRLTQFQALTYPDMQKAIITMQKQAGGQLKGLILDLRNNPGGLLESAIKVSSEFLDASKDGNEIIVYTEGRVPDARFVATADNKDVLNKAPMVVLINNGSASASEIVAGALKDNKRALIIGTKSFGKGSVQTILPLDDKRGIKLTTALYYTPSGTSIQATGIMPDIIIDDASVVTSANEKITDDFSESSLEKHLENGNKNSASKKVVESNDDKKLLKNDYQLYTALTILKGLALARK